MSLENREMGVQEVQVEEEGITLKDIFLIIKKHFIAICLFIVVVTAGGFGYAVVKDKVSPTYKASSTMLVQLDDSSNTAITSQYSFANYIAETFVSFIGDDVVLDPVAKEYNYTVKTVKKNLTITQTSGTLILSLSYVDKDPDVAAKVLNSIMVSTETVSQSKDADGNPKYKLLDNNIKTLSAADASKATKTSSKLKITLIFAAVGVVLAAIYTILREVLDTTFRSSEDVEKELGAPVIAAIPDYEFDDEKKGGKK